MDVPGLFRSKSMANTSFVPRNDRAARKQPARTRFEKICIVVCVADSGDCTGNRGQHLTASTESGCFRLSGNTKMFQYERQVLQIDQFRGGGRLLGRGW